MNISILNYDAFSNILCIIKFVLNIFIYVSFFIKTELWGNSSKLLLLSSSYYFLRLHYLAFASTKANSFNCDYKQPWQKVFLWFWSKEYIMGKYGYFWKNSWRFVAKNLFGDCNFEIWAVIETQSPVQIFMMLKTAKHFWEHEM